MTKKLLKRVSPILEQQSETEDLNYAPSPWLLKKCLKTDLVYLENPPNYDAFVEDISWDISYEKESEMRRQAEPTLYAISNFIKKVRLKYLKRNKIKTLVISYIKKAQTTGEKETNLLDIGCGWGMLLTNVLDELEPSVREKCVPFGIELSKELARKSSENFDRLLGGKCINATALEGVTLFEKDFFDIIVMASFLEHEINPLPLLQNCHQRLKTGGYIIIKVPNYASINRKVRAEKWCGFRWPDHVNYFTPKTLKGIAKKAGFDVQRMNQLDRIPFSDSMYIVLTKNT